MDVSEAADL
ncbi:unnamed protein product [Acanthoscelides obtectus]|uniref:Uncharacterized protein n=1 Tax=Acanthoscelides obtectus TaxID=200917 RepID=A0A9P0L2T8_ACAOB|nr:unnamed protein product [Acanthoscelides obtectus]CAK1662207.1 hypothetical protein AOBTE_LOCUS23036 [Acanthoscelides obtectus]